jgi:hypothetical protein
MEWDGKIQAPNFTCAVTGRVLVPGEVFWSALVPAQDGLFARRDMALDQWDGQDRSQFISWWRQRVPVPDKARQRLKLDEHLLRKLFHDLKDSRERRQQCLCFVVALCLVRARACKLETRLDRQGTTEFIIEDKSDRSRWLIRDPGMTPQDEAAVQQSLLDLIGLGEPVLADQPGSAAS